MSVPSIYQVGWLDRFRTFPPWHFPLPRQRTAPSTHPQYRSHNSSGNVLFPSHPPSPHPSQLCHPLRAFPQCHRDRRCSRSRGCSGTPFLQSTRPSSHIFRLASHGFSLWKAHPAICLLWFCPIHILPGPQQSHCSPGIPGSSSTIP